MYSTLTTSLPDGLKYTLNNCVLAYRKFTIQPNKYDLVK